VAVSFSCFTGRVIGCSQLLFVFSSVGCRCCVLWASDAVWGLLGPERFCRADSHIASSNSAASQPASHCVILCSQSKRLFSALEEQR